MWYRFQELTGRVRHTCFCDSPEKQFAEQKTISIFKKSGTTATVSRYRHRVEFWKI